MAQRLTRLVKLLVPAGGAKPGPAIGQSLGPLGLNMAEFCKDFNAKTAGHMADVPIPVVMFAYDNRTYDLLLKSPTSSWFIKRCAGIDKGATRPGYETVGYVTLKEIYHIAKLKQRDAHMWMTPLQGICRSIVASANSMGIEVVDDRQQSTEEAET
mmetsp:Transcript_30375/g.96921  ORF Transcript_30375/g.96921 Transcript_30375/m.96921 type:complete len:156 (-) Transcript_30375:181-648(-)